MANNRWVYKEIAESGRFLKMPQSTQVLYFHLVMNTNNEGVVEADYVMNMIHSNIGDLELLQDRGFVKILDEDHLTYVNSVNEFMEAYMEKRSGKSAQ